MRTFNSAAMLSGMTIQQARAVWLNLMYLPTSRSGQKPLLAPARDRLVDVESKAKALAESVLAAVDDPVLELLYTAAFDLPVLPQG